MPIYEFICRACGRRSSFFTRAIGDPLEPTCAHCGSGEMQRAISTFAYHRSLQTIHEESGPPPQFPNLDYYKDPRNIGRYAEESFMKYGLEMPDAVKESIQAAREGELPKEIVP